MHIKIVDVSFSDMAIYFKGTFVRILKPGTTYKPKWCIYTGTTADGLHRFRFGKESFDISKADAKMFVIDSVFPVGFFNRNDTKSVAYGERISARMNFKGLAIGTNYNLTPIENLLTLWGIPKASASNVTITEGLNYWWKIATANKPIDGSILTEIFESVKFTSPQEAFEQIKTHEVFARALSSDFAVTPNSKEAGLLVWFHALPVAEMWTKSKIKTLIPDYKQELMDFFEQKGVWVS